LLASLVSLFNSGIRGRIVTNSILCSSEKLKHFGIQVSIANKKSIFLFSLSYLKKSIPTGAVAGLLTA
jgi:hypothetical protein